MPSESPSRPRAAANMRFPVIYGKTTSWALSRRFGDRSETQLDHEPSPRNRQPDHGTANDKPDANGAHHRVEPGYRAGWKAGFCLSGSPRRGVCRWVLLAWVQMQKIANPQ